MHRGSTKARINADMLANPDGWKRDAQAKVVFGESLLTPQERSKLLPNWHKVRVAKRLHLTNKVFADTDDRAQRKMAQADERGDTIMQWARKHPGYILAQAGSMDRVQVPRAQDGCDAARHLREGRPAARPPPGGALAPQPAIPRTQVRPQ
jgi:hypothetical protein